MGLLGTVRHAVTRWARRILRDNRLLVRGYFEHVYRRPDPWAVADDDEAERRRQATLATIAGKRFADALEIGGGEGYLAERLADHVDRLLVVDISERALRRARERLADKPNVRAARLDLVAETLPGTFDLIVCSEVLVYVRPEDFAAVRDKILGALDDGGRLLLVHVRSIHDDEAGIEYKDFGAKTAHELFIDDPRTGVEVDEIDGLHRITLLRKTAAPPQAI